MPQAELDDRSQLCVPFILDRLAAHRNKTSKPFFIGLNGVQGAGKTTLVTALHTTLTTPPNSLSTAIFSIDDIYLTRAAQLHLASTHPTNPLLQHRGQPSTHDLPLGLSLFSALTSHEADVQIPVYDKSAFQGQGDRADSSEWPTVNKSGEAEDKRVQVVLFEGWCVGFRALGRADLKEKWRAAKEEEERGEGRGMLGKMKFEDVRVVNEALKGYDTMTDQLDAFVHIDAEDTHYVYDWRLEQESNLRAAKGAGMTDEQVIHFVNGYYPSYELFTDDLRSGVFPDRKGQQLRIVVGKDRKVVTSEVI